VVPGLFLTNFVWRWIVVVFVAALSGVFLRLYVYRHMRSEKISLKIEKNFALVAFGDITVNRLCG